MLPLTRSRNRSRFFGAPFSPASLFAGGTVAGAWYDPSDLTTLFTTSAGTTQCAMPGGGAAVSVGRMLDKSGNGNHAIAFNDTTARPELRARVNLLTYSEDFSNAVWTPTGVTVSTNTVVAPDGTTTADTITGDGAVSIHWLMQSNAALASGKTYSICGKAGTNNFIQLIFAGDADPWANFDLSAGSVGSTGTNVTATISSLGNGWYRCTISTPSSAASSIFVNLVNSASAPRNQSSALSTSVHLWGADLRPANIGANVPAYQRIADANTYDTAGFPLYLRFDGVDDSMYTPANLNLSGTDKVSVFAGVRYLGADVSNSLIAELSADYSLNNSAFGAWARLAFNSSSYAFASKGTAIASAGALQAAYVPPITSVCVGNGDISGDSAILRINGTQAAISTADQGSGNYGTYPLFIGSRNNTTLYFNGHLHSLIIAGSAVSAGNISATEQWVAGKTGIVIP